VIDITLEKPITFTDAASQFPSRHPGRPLSPMTIWRWAEGIGTPGGIRLDTVYLNGGRYTSLEAVNRFAQAVTAARQNQRTTPTPAPPPTSKQRRRELAQVDTKLDKAIGPAQSKPRKQRATTAKK
jgi:hypothetical protein